MAPWGRARPLEGRGMSGSLVSASCLCQDALGTESTHCVGKYLQCLPSDQQARSWPGAEGTQTHTQLPVSSGTRGPSRSQVSPS